jgi:hypothetical protein
LIYQCTCLCCSPEIGPPPPLPTTKSIPNQEEIARLLSVGQLRDEEKEMFYVVREPFGCNGGCCSFPTLLLYLLNANLNKGLCWYFLAFPYPVGLKRVSLSCRVFKERWAAV